MNAVLLPLPVIQRGEGRGEGRLLAPMEIAPWARNGHPASGSITACADAAPRPNPLPVKPREGRGEGTRGLGLELSPNGRRRLPDQSVQRFRNRLRGMRAAHCAGTLQEAKMRERISGWVAHAKYAETWRLRRTILGCGVDISLHSEAPFRNFGGC